MPEIRAEVVAELFGVLNDRRRTPDEALLDVMTHADATNAERMQAARVLADASREELVRAVTIEADAEYDGSFNISLPCSRFVSDGTR